MMIVAFIGIVVMAVMLFGAIPFTMMAMMAALTAASVAAALAATATAAFAAHHAEHALNLFIGGRTRCDDTPLKMQIFSCQRMVEVNYNLTLLYFKHHALKTVPVIVHQGDDVTGINVFGIKMPVR